ncbi:DUF2802 domain-containing protein [Gilvimarinus agarilyticus]|uniref:DUF2802 domain-containing protein n=1 Tax=Gilvimarinus agarilyticus TaxID=679259 RepID=UPI0006971001|nr:DUF2802 domain-containing protein [Gilvimarinus agarilyticus]
MSAWPDDSMALLAALAVAVALIALAVAIMAIRQGKRAHQQNRQALEKLERELALLQSGAVGMGQRILAMESRKNTTVDTSGGDSRLKPYSEASHLLSLGVDRDEVANRCGLSRAEASLLDALRHKKQP